MRVFSILILFVLVACHKRESSDSSANQDSAPIQVQLARAEAKTLPAFEPVVGTVKPRLEATISAHILGRILEFAVASGQKVNKGDVIARLDAEELEASHARAKAALDQMARELERQKKLLESNATSRSRYEQADAAERMARANLVKIKASLSKAVVLAPFTGTITRKFADTGDLAVPGKPLVQIEDPSSLRLETPVAESLAGTLALGQIIRVQVEAANLTMEGKIGELEPSADSASRTFLVKIDLPSSSGLRAGLFGRAWVPRGESRLLLVPASAVVRRGQMEVAFVATDGAAILRLVRTVPHGTDQCSVLSGLSEGEQVVLSPPVSLRDGSPLTTN
jgi:RND family efflux transporter MFP subunit